MQNLKQLQVIHGIDGSILRYMQDSISIMVACTLPVVHSLNTLFIIPRGSFETDAACFLRKVNFAPCNVLVPSGNLNQHPILGDQQLAVPRQRTPLRHPAYCSDV
jgi:hypothetical protein